MGYKTVIIFITKTYISIECLRRVVLNKGGGEGRGCWGEGVAAEKIYNLPLPLKIWLCHILYCTENEIILFFDLLIL